MRRLLLIPAVLMAATACTPPGAMPPTPAAMPSPTSAAAPTQWPPTPTPTATGAALSDSQLKNADYQLLQSNQVVTLVDGQYEAGAGPDYVNVRLLDPIAVGDLNGDAVDDAAVLLAEDYGGTGSFVALVVLLNQAGELTQAGAALIDDRPVIDTLALQAGQITVGAVIHGANDPMCCPAWPVTETFQLLHGRLILVQLSSQTPDGRTRAIQVDAPVPGSEATASILVKGQVTVSPFENNLVYRVVDAQGRLITEGPVPVHAAVLGGPGTFEALIDLTGIPANTAVQLEIVDVSAMDGSPLALAATTLLVR